MIDAVALSLFLLSYPALDFSATTGKPAPIAAIDSRPLHRVSACMVLIHECA
jgi:hypothetical protein